MQCGNHWLQKHERIERGSSYGVKLLLVPGGHSALAKPHEEGNREREDETGSDNDEPAEALSKRRRASEEGAAAIVRRAVISLDSAGETSA
jgi:hypothetical protein